MLHPWARKRSLGCLQDEKKIETNLAFNIALSHNEESTKQALH